MTLQEYVNQADPIRHPKVELDNTEITKGSTINIVGKGNLTQIWITDGSAKLMWGIPYVKWDSDSTLWTTDSDGNPKARSVFYLK
jgi:hypothetical protein